MRRYGSGTNAWISRSRLTIIASVGVCTLPSETTPPTHARPRIVAARVAFMPTSQSASERERAASSSDCICGPGRSFSKPSRIACLVIDEIQSLSTGFGGFSFVADAPNTDSYTYAKISSPSRPASQALMTWSMSSRLSSVSISFSCFFALASRGTSLSPFGGTIGRSAMRHFFHFSSYSSGSASWTRWPTAHVITYSSDSRKTGSSRAVRDLGFDVAFSTTSSAVSSVFFLPRFGLMSSSLRRWKGPSSAPARSRPTEGFSAITRVLAIENTIASRQGRPAGDTWPRAAQPLLHLCRLRVVAAPQRPVPAPCRRRRESAAGRGLRARREPRLQLRPLAAGDPALAPPLPALHGEIGAVLVAARAPDQRRRGLQGATRRTGRRGGQHRRGARQGRPHRRDVPARHAPAKGPRQEASAPRAHGRRAHRARSERTARPGGDCRHRPPLAARAVAGLLRQAGRCRRARSARGDREADGRDRTPQRRSMSEALLDRQRGAARAALVPGAIHRRHAEAELPFDLLRDLPPREVREERIRVL